ncbi:hypothetical protein CSUNSWCD_291 [Campylobacter showae CSUNSWCD]|uniref:Uncharacterized protein n=1 Tax=Campylobacter showae CSUNSWCD TaxID=1244083 RepID=M5ISB8_9BACT|nr:hypothetical protein CSUNSWCD_291 [Campylobacter showae CSUNSWCD]
MADSTQIYGYLLTRVKFVKLNKISATSKLVKSSKALEILRII